MHMPFVPAELYLRKLTASHSHHDYTTIVGHYYGGYLDQNTGSH